MQSSVRCSPYSTLRRYAGRPRPAAQPVKPKQYPGELRAAQRREQPDHSYETGVRQRAVASRLPSRLAAGRHPAWPEAAAVGVGHPRRSLAILCAPAVVSCRRQRRTSCTASPRGSPEVRSAPGRDERQRVGHAGRGIPRGWCPDGAGWRLTRVPTRQRLAQTPPSGFVRMERQVGRLTRPRSTATASQRFAQTPPIPACDLLIYGSAKCGTAKTPQKNGAAVGRPPMRWSPAVPELTRTPCAPRPGHDFLARPLNHLFTQLGWPVLRPPAHCRHLRDQFLQIVGRTHTQHHSVRTFSRPRSKGSPHREDALDDRKRRLADVHPPMARAACRFAFASWHAFALTAGSYPSRLIVRPRVALGSRHSPASGQPASPCKRRCRAFCPCETSYLVSR